MATDVEIRLIAENKDAVKGIREVGKESEKLNNTVEKNHKKQKGFIEKEIQMQKQLTERRNAATNKENLKIYNNLLADSRKRLEELEGAGLKTEKQTTSLIGKMGKLALAYFTLNTAMKIVKETALAFFTKSEQGFELLERKVSGFKAAIGVLQGEFIKLGKSIDGDKATPWGTKLVNGLRAIIFSTSNLIQLIPGVKEYFTDLEKRMNDAGKAAEKYTRILQELEDAERSMIVPRAKANAEIIKARTIAADEEKSAPVRIAALQKALDLEKKTAEAEIKHQQLVVLNLRDRNEELKKSGMLRDEDLKELEENIAREISLQTESDQRQLRAFRELQSTKKEIAEKAAAELKSVVAGNMKAMEELYNKLWDNLVKQEKIDNDLKSEVRKLLGISSDDLGLQTNQSWLNSNKKALADIKILNDQEKKEGEERIEALKRGLNELLAFTQEIADRQLEDAQRRRELLDTQIDETQQAVNQEIELYKAGYAANVQAKQKQLDELKAQRDKALKEEEEAIKKQRAMESIAQGVNIFTSATQILKTFTKTLGPLGLALAAGAITSMFALIGSAKSKSAEMGFAKGGWTGEGGRRDKTGERVAGLVHEREFVVRRGPAHKFRSVLEAINRDDKRAIFNSFNKISPAAVNNIVIDNEGSNKRLDEVNMNLKRLNNKEEVSIVGNMTIYKKGGTTRIIKKR